MSSPSAKVSTREPPAAFGYGATTTGVEVLPSGHIHANFLVTTASGRLVIQRLNTYVFADINAVLSKRRAGGGHLAGRGRPSPRLVETPQGAPSFRSGDGSTWRAFHYLEGTEGRDMATGPTDAYDAANTFAGYVTALTDLPAPRLIETIPNFHDLRARLARLDEVIASDPVGRRPAVARDRPLPSPRPRERLGSHGNRGSRCAHGPQRRQAVQCALCYR